MTFILEAGYTFWNPLMWIIAFLIAMVVVYFFRRQGQNKYKKDTAQTRIFFCGEEVPEAGQRHIRVGNIYWGFFETLKQYYQVMTRVHTGIINDYVIWFVAILAVTILVLVLAS